MRFMGKKILEHDGYKIRNSNPDFDIVASDTMSGIVIDGRVWPHIPKGEIWFDRRYRAEKSFLLKVHALEVATRRWPYAKTRAYLKRKLCLKGTPPNFVVRRESRDGLTLLYVRGDIVRKYMDPGFIFGGHDLVYGYIAENEVWIDIRQDPREIPFVVAHEMYERDLMRRGHTYSDAHRQATDIEHALRLKQPKRKARRPLRMKPFRQHAGFCGPASLKIAAEHYGRVYSERELDKLCRQCSGRRRSTTDYGTDHLEMIGAAEALGAVVVAKNDGTIEDLRNWVLKQRVPVIVGWFVADPGNEGDHFSVVYHLTRTHVYLMDPEQLNGRRKMSLKKFQRLWWDNDTSKNLRANRWFMAANFAHKTVA